MYRVSDNLKDLAVECPNALGNVYFGAQIGDGWVKLVERVVRLCELEGVRITQIKEKFGRLRIYTDRIGSAELSTSIIEAEDASGTFCEVCGDAATTTESGSGWLSTLCVKCRS